MTTTDSQLHDILSRAEDKLPEGDYLFIANLLKKEHDKKSADILRVKNYNNEITMVGKKRNVVIKLIKTIVYKGCRRSDIIYSINGQIKTTDDYDELKTSLVRLYRMTNPTKFIIKYGDMEEFETTLKEYSEMIYEEDEALKNPDDHVDDDDCDCDKHNYSLMYVLGQMIDPNN